MPKFGPEKKMDVARESGARVEKSNIESSKARVKPAAERKLNVRPAADKSVVAAPASRNAGAAPAAEKRAVATARKARGNGWVSQWGSKLSSLVSQKPKPARSAITRFNGVPVQGELSLDNIKVVRNDLSDTDLEVVARKVTPTVTPTVMLANSVSAADKNVGVTAPARLEQESAAVEAVET